MTVIDPPTERECERCGRKEVWDEQRQTFVAASDDEKDRGAAHCLHEWDINGTYNPLRRRES
jgi:hypothetical protein